MTPIEFRETATAVLHEWLDSTYLDRTNDRVELIKHDQDGEMKWVLQDSTTREVKQTFILTLACSEVTTNGSNNDTCPGGC